MKLKERLRFCKLCNHKRLDTDKGLLCQLTQEKPAFEESCPEYSECFYDRKNYERNLFDEKITRGQYQLNSYPTSKWLVAIAEKILPSQFVVKRFEIGRFLVVPLFLLVVLIIVAGLDVGIMYQIFMVSVIIALATVVSVKNWRSFKKSAQELAVINSDGIKMGNEVVCWRDITLIYVKAKFLKPTCLVLETLSRLEPMQLSIKSSVGSGLILTICEAYRKKNAATFRTRL